LLCCSSALLLYSCCIAAFWRILLRSVRGVVYWRCISVWVDLAGEAEGWAMSQHAWHEWVVAAIQSSRRRTTRQGSAGGRCPAFSNASRTLAATSRRLTFERLEERALLATIQLTSGAIELSASYGSTSHYGIFGAGDVPSGTWFWYPSNPSDFPYASVGVGETFEVGQQKIEAYLHGWSLWEDDPTYSKQYNLSGGTPQTLEMQIAPQSGEEIGEGVVLTIEGSAQFGVRSGVVDNFLGGEPQYGGFVYASPGSYTGWRESFPTAGSGNYSALYTIDGETRELMGGNVSLLAPAGTERSTDGLSLYEREETIAKIGDALEASLSLSWASALGNYTSGSVSLYVYARGFGDDLIAQSLEWDSELQRFDFVYETQADSTYSQLPASMSAGFFWARGPEWEDRISEAVQQSLNATPNEPQSGALNYSELGSPPPDATHLLFVLDPENVILEGRESNNVAAAEISRVDLSTGVYFEDGELNLSYYVSHLPLTQSASLSLYWAENYDPTSIISGPVYTLSIGPAPRETYESFTLPISVLGDRPAGAAYVIAVIDPENLIQEADEIYNWSATGYLFDLDADGIRWNSLEEGGGFTFEYEVENPANLPIPNATIQFFWLEQGQQNPPYPEPVYTYALEGTAKSAGSHTVRVLHQDLPAGLRIPESTTAAVPQFSMVIDPGGLVEELSETNNRSSVPLAPLVVNVATHGWMSSASIWTSKEYIDALTNMPADGSILDQRVKTYVSNWDSNKGFTGAVLALAAARLFDVYRGGGGIAVALLDIIANRLATESKVIAYDAAVGIVRDVEAILLPRHESERLQRIQLIGHSRGAAVNALVSKMLRDHNYRNIETYVALDGVSTDWPLGVALVADANISSAVVAANEKINFMVQEGLAGFLAADIPAWLGSVLGRAIAVTDIPVVDSLIQVAFGALRAPPRAGFLNQTIVGQGEYSPSEHTNISELYFKGDPVYRNQSYVGRKANAGLPGGSGAEAHDAAVFLARSGSSGEAGVLGVEYGFLDGGFDEIGQMWTDAQGADLTPTGDLFIDYFLQTLVDPEALLASGWQVTGNAQLADVGGDFVAQVVHAEGGSSISQLVILPPHASALEFDLNVMSAATGDILTVLMDDQVLVEIDLTAVTATRQSIPLPESSATSASFTFLLNGPTASTASIALDDFAVISGNHAPQLTPFGPRLDTIPRTITEADNHGTSVWNLTWGMSDQDFDPYGVAITGIDSTHGTVQFSLDDGDTWADVGAVSESHARLIAANELTRLRFVPDGVFVGTLEDVVTFRAWDGTTGIDGLSGDFVDATQIGGSTPFSAATESASIRLILSGDFNTDGVVNSADYLVWRKTLSEYVEPYSGADGDGDGMVDADDLNVWRAHFGETLPPAAPPLPGDYNRDGTVDSADYVVWRKTMGSTGMAAYSGADGNGDTTVDQDDLAVWKAHFGQTLLGPTIPALPGDYNEDSSVDSADYAVWRKTLGTTGVTPYSGADGDGDGMIDQDDFSVWRANFGETLGGGNGEGGGGSGSVDGETGRVGEGEDTARSHPEGTRQGAGSAEELRHPEGTRDLGLRVEEATAGTQTVNSDGGRFRFALPVYDSEIRLQKRLATGQRRSTVATASMELRDATLLAWLASRGDEERAVENESLRRARHDADDSSDSRFEAVDAVFDELLLAAAGV
jgi:hypothetical protein